jgi:hypothetical protein
MIEGIHRLIYYSRNNAAGSPETMAVTIQSILAAARRNNASVGVTGALMFNAGCFAQVLEGPKAAVEHTFERIQQDERHGDVSVLTFGPVADRSFDRWSMGFVGESVADAEQYGNIANQSGYDPSRMTGDALFATLQRLMREEEGVVASPTP